MKFYFGHYSVLPGRLGRVLGLAIALLPALAGCLVGRPPSAAFPGIYSTTTGLHDLVSSFDENRSLFDDEKALHYYLPACPPDTTGVVRMDWAAFKAVPNVLPVGLPGAILLARDGRGIDEAEVPNIEWKRYQLRLAAKGIDPQHTMPLAAALPVPDYYRNAFYNYCPVVGISYEQAVTFCRWRGRVIGEAINRSSLGSPDSAAANHIVVECRLPTEAEWELAALAKRQLPYGNSCLELPIAVNPKAAGYLKQRAGSNEAQQQIKTDIQAYNLTKPSRSPINCAQPEPYFLRLQAPAYVYGGPTNDYRLYNLLGNAAEMVQERGIAKGGSYRDPLSACTVTARNSYAGPSPTVGFRCIIRGIYPNRK